LVYVVPPIRSVGASWAMAGTAGSKVAVTASAKALFRKNFFDMM
jgi:hypothetical protein